MFFMSSPVLSVVPKLRPRWKAQRQITRRWDTTQNLVKRAVAADMLEPERAEQFGFFAAHHQNHGILTLDDLAHAMASLVSSSIMY
jgi:hypothetical protein